MFEFDVVTVASVLAVGLVAEVGLPWGWAALEQLRGVPAGRREMHHMVLTGLGWLMVIVMLTWYMSGIPADQGMKGRQCFTALVLQGLMGSFVGMFSHRWYAQSESLDHPSH